MTEIETRTTGPSEAKLCKPRLALVCDFLEENWPSMDLVADMVFDRLQQEHVAAWGVTRLCPPLRRRFGKFASSGNSAFFQNADRLLNRFVDYRRYLKPQLENFDLFHLIDHSYSQLVHDLPAGKTVVTCHDLDTFRCVLEPELQPRPRWFRAMAERILGGFRKAAHVIAVSSATRDEILRFGLHPAERVTVIPNGVHPSFSPLPDPAADVELSRLLASHAGEPAWLLNVGSVMHRKRLDLLLRVFAEVRRRVPKARLLRVGEPFSREQRQLARQLGVETSIVELSRLSGGVLAAVYRRADLLVHTAEAEGFGLPLVEAMACGCPVLASDIRVLREVGGVAATYCKVGDIAGWADHVVALLASRQDNALREEARRREFANASRFSWSENAAQTVHIYRKLLGRGL